MNYRTSILAGLIAGALATGVAHAQPGGMGCDMMGGGMKGGMMGKKGGPDMGARAQQHLDGFKTELKITSEQEPLWQAFAEKMKANMEAMKKSMPPAAADANLTAPERMAQRTTQMKEKLAAMEASHESFKRLYDALSPEQKKVADAHMSQMGGGMKKGGGMMRKGLPSKAAPAQQPQPQPDHQHKH